MQQSKAKPPKNTSRSGVNAQIGGKENEDQINIRLQPVPMTKPGVRPISQQEKVVTPDVKLSSARMDQTQNRQQQLRTLHTSLGLNQLQSLDTELRQSSNKMFNSNQDQKKNGKATKREITGRRVDQPQMIVNETAETFEVQSGSLLQPKSQHQIQNGKPLNTTYSPSRDKSKDRMSKVVGTSKRLKSLTQPSSTNGAKQNGQKAKRITDFLNASIVQPPKVDSKTNINIIPALDVNSSSLQETMYLSSSAQLKQRPRSQERTKVQMKQLNFQRESVLKSRASSGGGSKQLNSAQIIPIVKNLNKTLSTSGDRKSLGKNVSPRSRSGGAIQQLIREEKRIRDNSQELIRNKLALSVLDVQMDMSKLIQPSNDLSQKSDLNIFQMIQQQQNRSMLDKSTISLLRANQNASKLSQIQISKQHSPPKSGKIDQIIKANLRKIQKDFEIQRREKKEREEGSLRRKQLLENANQIIRAQNREKTQKRKQKLGRHDETIIIDDTEHLEKALLAVSDSIGMPGKRIFDSNHSPKQFRAIQTQKQLGLKSLKQQIRQLDEELLLDRHRKQQGMDFINVRKEISSELRTIDTKMRKHLKMQRQEMSKTSIADRQLKVKTGNTLKQELIPLRFNHIFSPSDQAMNVHQIVDNVEVNPNREQNLIQKREKIRKFMKDKAKVLQLKQDTKKMAEIREVRKVQKNLLRLNKFVMRKALERSSGAVTPALKVKGKHQKNVTVCYDEPVEKLNNDKTITPNRNGLFEFSEASLNISGKNHRIINRSALGHHARDLQKQHDTLYEDSRISSNHQTIDPEIKILKRRELAGSTLGVCFEKSAGSSRQLQTQLRKSQSPQEFRQKKPKRRLQSASVVGKKKKGKREKRPSSSQGKQKPLVNLPGPGRITVQVTKQESEESNQQLVNGAAKVIQKEVRKFLGNLGFYEARQIESIHRSPSQDQMIDLYIEPRSASKSKNSRGSGKKSTSGKRHSRKQSFEYELVAPKSGIRAQKQLRLSPDQIRDLKEIEELKTQEEMDTKLISDKKGNARLLHTESEKLIISPSIESGKKRSTDKKRVSEDIIKEKNVKLIKRYPESKREEGFNMAKLKDYLGSSTSSNGPANWGINSIATPSSANAKILSGIGRLPVSSPHSDGISQSSNSIFERNAFQQYSQKKLNNILEDNEFKRLIKFREECLVFREERESQHLKKQLKKNQINPKTYQDQKAKIEKWVQIEKREIERTKTAFQQEWDKTLQMIEDTQKNVDQIRLKMHTDSNNSYSQNSGVPPLPPLVKPRLNNYLINEAPKSYRSGASHSQPTDVVHDSDLGVLSSRRSALKGDAVVRTTEDIKQSKNTISASKSQMVSKSEIKSKQPEPNTNPLGVVTNFDIQSDSKKRFSSSSDQFRDEEDYEHEPSAEFLKRLEKATNGLLHESAQGTLNIEEHSFAGDDDIDPSKIEIFSDEKFQNRLVNIKDISDLLKGDQLSDQSSSGKSEPKMGGPTIDQAIINESLKLAEKLQQKPDLRNSMKTEENSLAIVEEPKEINETNLIPVVAKPFIALKNLQDEKYKNNLANQITDDLMNSLMKNLIEIPDRKHRKKEIKSELPDHDVYIADHYQMDKEEKREWVEIRQRHLIEGELIRVDSYVNELVDVLLQYDISDISEGSNFDYEIKSNDNFHIQFLKLLTQPIIREPSNTLMQMQVSELGSYLHFETTLDCTKHPIVPVDLYLEIEKAREEALIQRRGVADQNQQQQRESVFIFNKCIFDGINESLMKFRPYGLVGEPMPWSNKVRRLQTKVDIASVDTERLFQMVKQEVFRWTQVLCGCLPGPIFNFPNMRSGKDEFSEEMYQEVRERRLTAALSSETVEQEHHWLNYEFEEAQVKIDISDMILETLVGELVGFMQSRVAIE